jgi:HAD superfamily hydrolase (TIGR01549 family)
MIKAVLFDLDGTLNDVDTREFGNIYYKTLAKKFPREGLSLEDTAEECRNAVRAMIRNKNYGESLEKIFTDYIRDNIGVDFEKSPELLTDYLNNEYNEVLAVFKKQKGAAETVKKLHAAGFLLVIATNPLFSHYAIKRRLDNAGLDESDFEFLTTYDWIKATKPHKEFYLEIANRLGVKPEECLMVGNDVKNDMAARHAGMQVLLITHRLSNRNNEDISAIDKSDISEVYEYVMRKNGRLE